MRLHALSLSVFNQVAITSHSSFLHDAFCPSIAAATVPPPLSKLAHPSATSPAALHGSVMIFRTSPTLSPRTPTPSPSTIRHRHTPSATTQACNPLFHSASWETDMFSPLYEASSPTLLSIYLASITSLSSPNLVPFCCQSTLSPPPPPCRRRFQSLPPFRHLHHRVTWKRDDLPCFTYTVTPLLHSFIFRHPPPPHIVGLHPSHHPRASPLE